MPVLDRGSAPVLDLLDESEDEGLVLYVAVARRGRVVELAGRARSLFVDRGDGWWTNRDALVWEWPRWRRLRVDGFALYLSPTGGVPFGWGTSRQGPMAVRAPGLLAPPGALLVREGLLP